LQDAAKTAAKAMRSTNSRRSWMSASRSGRSFPRPAASPLLAIITALDVLIIDRSDGI
jgi:hypothetical protein